MKKAILVGLTLAAVSFADVWSCAGYCKKNRSDGDATAVSTEGPTMGAAFKALDVICTPGYLVGGQIAADGRSWADALLTPQQACSKN